jgi:hypothetical protein
MKGTPWACPYNYTLRNRFIDTSLLLIALAGSAHAKLRESAKGMRLEDFVDSRFAKKVDDEGLFDRLYKR